MRFLRPINFMILASFGLHLWITHSFDPGIGSSPGFETEENIIELTPIPEPELANKELNGQVVELPPGPETEPPEDYKYLAERNLRVAFQSAGRPDRSGASVPAPPSMIMELEEKEEGSFDVTVVNTRALFPSYRDLKDWLADEPGRIDHLESVPYGEITQVNAHSYKYALFFNQLKRTLYFYWNPSTALILSSRPSRDLETRLLVVVEKNGVLHSVEVIQSCGYERVDQAAKEAFQRTAPIYNIPEGLLNDRGYLEMIWSFIIVF
jgi:TonB family protein